jgi:threonine aldolase
MADLRIDLYSDTITRPTPGMRAFISQAEVGDEQQQEDPTVNRLVETVCELLDKEAAVFLPSGPSGFTAGQVMRLSWIKRRICGTLKLAHRRR